MTATANDRADSTLDVRVLPPMRRHAEIFRTFEALAPGGTFVLVNDHEPKPLLYTFQAERAGQFEWSVLEAGPERWRIEIRRRPEPGIRAVGEHLGGDHRRLDAIFEDVLRLVRAGSFEKARPRFAEFRCGLDHHIEAEERVLFPAFEEGTGVRHGGPTDVMRAEHVEIRRLMGEVAGALEAGAADRTLALAAQLYDVLHAHNVKEENILYPATDGLSGERGRDDLVRRMQAV